MKAIKNFFSFLWFWRPRPKREIIKLISKEPLVLDALSGDSRITKNKYSISYSNNCEFYDPYGRVILGSVGKPTEKSPFQVHKLVRSASLLKIFGALPGKWEQKWMTENQVESFCQKFPEWLNQDSCGVMFLCKKEELMPVNEENPRENLFVIIKYGKSFWKSFLEDYTIFTSKENSRIVARMVE